jgi:hypothetical protein
MAVRHGGSCRRPADRVHGEQRPQQHDPDTIVELGFELVSRIV